MSRYMDAVGVVQQAIALWSENDGDSAMQSFIDYLRDMPTVDAEPVRHGRWIMEFDKKTQSTNWRCSACGGCGRGDYKRCPWCGAKMEE